MRTYLVLIALVLAAPLARGANSPDKPANCEFVSGPLFDLKESITGKDVAVGVAECERADGVDFVTLVYGAASKCNDATECAGDESIPKLKMVSPPLELAIPSAPQKGSSSK